MYRHFIAHRTAELINGPSCLEISLRSWVIQTAVTIMVTSQNQWYINILPLERSFKGQYDHIQHVTT